MEHRHLRCLNHTHEYHLIIFHKRFIHFFVYFVVSYCNDVGYIPNIMRLLIVEDEPALAEVLKSSLASRGYAVDWIPNGKKAWMRILMYRKDYDMILLDLMLPDMNGLQITESVRKENVTTPIIILTSRTETEHKVELLNKGADDYLIKPFSLEELLARINSVMRRPVVSQPTILTHGPVQMDMSTRIVRVHDSEVPLTLKEFAILEQFLRDPNKVLTRENLIDHVWDFNALSMSNVLDVHMKNLRKKLASKTEKSLFETVRGVGYRLTNPKS